MITILLIILTIIASVSPILTFASLWQVKEWRIDRLKEHLRNEGYLRQLFGLLRPGILIFFVAFWFTEILTPEIWLITTLVSLVGASTLQIALGKQPKPVWTRKAQVLVLTSLILTAVVAAILLRSPKSEVLSPLLLLLPLTQPFILLISWTLFWPLDRLLKRRIMERAKALRAQHPDLIVIGVTGSVGKTTTKELLAHVLQGRNPFVTPAHVNTEMGVSQWIICVLGKREAGSGKRQPEHPASHVPHPEILIVEMGAYREGEIALLCDIVQPTIGVVTFIGTQHVALFGSQEALCQAKAELIQALPEDGHAFLNSDSSLCTGLQNLSRAPVTTVGTGGHADLEAFDIEETPNGIRFHVGESTIAIPLHGTHNVTNVLLAIAIAEHLGMPHNDSTTRLRSFSPPKQTFEVREERGVTILDDTHNASPESFKAALAWVRTQPMEHKILLTSGIIELGQKQDQIHTELGSLAADLFDDVICLNKRSAKNFARGLGKDVTIFSKKIPKIEPGSLLVCIGRMSPKTILRLLPNPCPPKPEGEGGSELINELTN